MLGALLRLLSACGGVWPTSPAPPARSSSSSSAAAAVDQAAAEGRDGLLWWRDLARCHAGELSVAVVQGNHVLEDQCRVESGPPPLAATCIGVFDGHAGPDAARFACDHLLPNLRGEHRPPSPFLPAAAPPETRDLGLIRAEAASGPEGVTADAIRDAFLATEEGFLAVVSRMWEAQPDMATVGTCCLVGVVHQRTLFVANLGDSRAVLGKKVGRAGQITAEQLSSEHNANEEDVRQELMAQHPDDPQIVALKHGVWRVKGIIQVGFYRIVQFPVAETGYCICNIYIFHFSVNVLGNAGVQIIRRCISKA